MRTRQRAAVMFLTTFTVIAYAAARSWTFDKDSVGKIAPGWNQASGNWRVIADATAPSKPNVLAQVSNNHTGSYSNVAVANEPSLKDVTISVRSRAVAGQEDQGGGPVWRYRNLRNYYIARQNNLENNYRVYKVVNSRRIQLSSARLEARRGACQTAARRLTNFSAAIRPPSAA
jgi:hypothetical protein